MLDVSKFTHIPFVDKGRSFTGSDCWGVIYLLYKDLLQIELPLYLDAYKNTADEEEIAAIIGEKKKTWEEVAKPDVYDVLLFRIGGHEMHVGVYIGDGRFIHCRKAVNTVIERLHIAEWRDRFVGCYRYKK